MIFLDTRKQLKQELFHREFTEKIVNACISVNWVRHKSACIPAALAVHLSVGEVTGFQGGGQSLDRGHIRSPDMLAQFLLNVDGADKVLLAWRSRFEERL